MTKHSLKSPLLPNKQTLPNSDNVTPLSPHPEHPELRRTHNAIYLTSLPFHRIGHGFCGSVWVVNGSGFDTYAIKGEDGGEGGSVHKDFIMHQKVFTVIHGLRSPLPQTLAISSSIVVPACHQYVQQDDSTWWSEKIGRFPKQFPFPSDSRSFMRKTRTA